MQELKATKVKEKNSLEAKLLATLVAHLLPLADFFASNFSFSTLPDVISDNTPVPFFIEYFRFSSSFYIVSLYFSY